MNSKKLWAFLNSTQVLLVIESKQHVIGIRKVSYLFMLFCVLNVIWIKTRIKKNQCIKSKFKKGPCG